MKKCLFFKILNIVIILIIISIMSTILSCVYYYQNNNLLPIVNLAVAMISLLISIISIFYQFISSKKYFDLEHYAYLTINFCGIKYNNVKDNIIKTNLNRKCFLVDFANTKQQKDDLICEIRGCNMSNENIVDINAHLLSNDNERIVCNNFSYEYIAENVSQKVIMSPNDEFKIYLYIKNDETQKRLLIKYKNVYGVLYKYLLIIEKDLCLNMNIPYKLMCSFQEI